MGLSPFVCAVCLSVFVCVGCSRGEVREWSASDHDQPEGASAPTARGPRAASSSDDGQVVDVAWAKQCASCHGASGRGDGPSGPMVKAPDLSDPAWQARVTDAQIAQVIVEGRGKMPRFDLPPPLVAGLVKRVRQTRR